MVITNELDTVYITSSGDRYLKKIDALCAESQIQTVKEHRERKRKKIMDTVELIHTVLKDKNWGVYYKSNPMAEHPLQDGGTLYKINEVDEEELERVLTKRLTECQTQTQSLDSQTDSNQNENSMTG